MTALLVERVRESGGDEGVVEMLRIAGSERSPEYLLDIVNWVSYDEAVALLRAGARVTQHPRFAHAVGEDAAEQRLRSIFETAGDLIAADQISDALARITDRAAREVRAQRYLLAVQIAPDGELHCHHKGFADHEVAGYVERILGEHSAALPENWLVVPVRSARRDYGRLLAMYDPGGRFFPQERELLEVYARYAASALDSATALMEAKQRYEQSSALLTLARALASAGTSGEVARKLSDAVGMVVDCDRVGVYLWDPALGELVATREHQSALAAGDRERSLEQGTHPGWDARETPGQTPTRANIRRLRNRRPRAQGAFGQHRRGGNDRRTARDARLAARHARRLGAGPQRAHAAQTLLARAQSRSRSSISTWTHSSP